MIRGALSMLFGVAVLVLPDISLLVLVLFVGTWLLADGLLALALAFTHAHRRFQVLDGAVGVAVGLIAIMHPNVNGLTLIVIVAVWAIARGVLQLLLAMDLGSRKRGAWNFGAIGAGSLVFGALLLSNPGTGALAAIGLIAGFAVLLGLAYISTGFWLEQSTGVGLSHEPSRVIDRRRGQ